MGKFDDLLDINVFDMIEENKEPLAVGLATLIALLSLYYFFYTPTEQIDGIEPDYKSCIELCKSEGYGGAVNSSCTSVVNCESPNIPLSNEANSLCKGIDTCCCTQSTCDSVCKNEGYSGALSDACSPVYECETPNIPIESEECGGVNGCCCEQ